MCFAFDEFISVAFVVTVVVVFIVIDRVGPSFCVNGHPGLERFS